ncbi:MAG: hypothetical protein SGJ19_24030 [Planctomycetia bacterium]|nr:hypothetical protein [Planctomycetia bacterium]
MKPLWKTRTGLSIVVLEIVLGLTASSAFACGGIGIGVSVGGRGGSHSRSYPQKRVHVHRQTSVMPVVAKVAPPALPTVIRPASLVTPQPAPQPQVQFPLELVDVRLVDLGNASAGVGPRFRLVLKNVTPATLSQPFEVVLTAGISRDFSPALPTGVETVAEIAAGAVLPVDVRLPVDAMTMNYPGRPEPAPFSTVFVMVNGPKNAAGASSVTTMAVLDLADVRLVDMSIAASNAAAEVGTPVALPGEGFGLQAGKVTFNVAGLKLDAELLDWSENGITVRMPQLALTSPTPVQLLVTRADGQAATPLTLTAVLPVAAPSNDEVPFPTSPLLPEAPEAEATGEEAQASVDTETEASPSLAFGGLGLPELPVLSGSGGAE